MPSGALPSPDDSDQMREFEERFCQAVESECLSLRLTRSIQFFVRTRSQAQLFRAAIISANFSAGSIPIAAPSMAAIQKYVGTVIGLPLERFSLDCRIRLADPSVREGRRMKTYSMDLRERIVAAFGRGEGDPRRLAQRFSVRIAWVYRLLL